jgi:hypothetical protein
MWWWLCTCIRYPQATWQFLTPIRFPTLDSCCDKKLKEALIWIRSTYVVRNTGSCWWYPFQEGAKKLQLYNPSFKIWQSQSMAWKCSFHMLSWLNFYISVLYISVEQCPSNLIFLKGNILYNIWGFMLLLAIVGIISIFIYWLHWIIVYFNF